MKRMYRHKFTHKFTCCPCHWCLCVFWMQHGSAQKLKPSKASVDAMDIMKLAGGIVGGSGWYLCQGLCSLQKMDQRVMLQQNFMVLQGQ